MNASEFTTTINALFERLNLDDANVFVHEGDMPFGVRGEKKRVRGCYLSKDAEGELCIVIEAETQKQHGVTENKSVCRSCENCTRRRGCEDVDFNYPQEAEICPKFNPEEGDAK